MPLPDVLRRFRAAGATSIALQEDTIGALEDAGRLQIVSAGRAGTSLLPEPGLFNRVADAVAVKTRWASARQTGARGSVLFIEQPYALVRGVGVGLDPQSVDEVQAADLGVVGRVSNWQGVQPRGIVWSLHELKKQGASTVIFSGDEVLGFKGFIHSNPLLVSDQQPSTETALRETGLYYGAVEFVKQKGDALLSRAAQDRLVRVHTVSGAEMLSADVNSNTQRFLLGARERNIRLLFVRLFLSEPDPIPANSKYIEKIARGLDRGDLEPGFAHGYDPLTTSPLLRGLMGLGLAAAFLLLVETLTAFSAGGAGKLTALIAALGALGLLALPLLPGGVKLAALAAACVFPTLGLVATDLLRPGPPRSAPLTVALMRFLKASAITSLGILITAGLLSDRLFLIKADMFLGIKAAHLVPVLIVAGVYSLSLWASEERRWPRVMGDAGRRVLSLGAQPVLFWQVAFALAALVMLALVVLRSGNDPGVGVSGLELRVRSLLDRFLYARPRFKEFLVGHPALIVALALAARGLGRSAALPGIRLIVTALFLVGALGQVSLLNTFCHLHTPLPVSLWRAGLGLVIGTVIGIAAYLILDRALLRRLPV